MRKPVICIGIVAYDGLEGQVAKDYMSMMYHLGRHCPDFDFQLAIKWKSEQFRARNAIVKAALQFGADYIWMLDDDHILDIEDSRRGYVDAYDIPIKLVKRLEENPKIGVVGALYYQRGGQCLPVIMQESRDDDRPYFLSHAEISNRMQKVDVTGGGCMMIRASIFDKIESPWFAPEHEWGTDIQLCKQARAAGFEVWCDTSLQIGHLQREKRLITAKTAKDYVANKDEYAPLVRYRDDAMEYLGMTLSEIAELALKYDARDLKEWTGTLKEYYASRGPEQLARQVAFHHSPHMVEEMKFFQSIIRTDGNFYGADYGCGSAPVGFELAIQGNRMDFIDIDGAGGYEFTKWRAKKRNVKAGFKLAGPYDYVMMMDAIEHIEDWQTELGEILSRIKEGGILITNYFRNRDFNNPEHVSMDHEAVRQFLVERGFESDSGLFWVKKESREAAA